MPQAREILRRISSVHNTQQITRAMKMVAAAKLNRAQGRMLAMRPYADGIGSILRHIARDLFGDEHSLLKPRMEVKRVLTIVIAGDRGLCGGFNTNAIRNAIAHLQGMPKVEHELIAIGKRANAGLRKLPHPIKKTYFDVFDNLSFVLSTEIARQLLEGWAASEAERVDEVYLVYNQFVSVMAQRPMVQKLLPLDLDAMVAAERKDEAAAEPNPPRPIYDIDPDPEVVLEHLVSHHLSTEIYRATVESYAAELAARMTAMDSATNNAEDMIDRLTMDYNRARQAGITAELLDIVGGANALQ